MVILFAEGIINNLIMIHISNMELLVQWDNSSESLYYNKAILLSFVMTSIVIAAVVFCYGTK